MRGLGRRLRHTFGISAPRMTVRTHLSWRWKIPAIVALLSLVVGMWWWGFDFGQLLGGSNRGEVAEKRGKLENDVAQFREENAKLRARAAQLDAVAKEAGMENPVEMAIRFGQSKPGVSTVLVGYSHQQHLEDAIRYTERGPLPDDLVQRILAVSVSSE